MMLSGWDITLIIAVSLMGTAVAYIRNPEYKAFVLMLPVPFTLAFLALGRPLDATNVLAMFPMFGFTLGTWFLHARLRCPIVLSILLCAIGYIAIGTGLASVIPAGGTVFWGSVVLTLLAALALIRTLPYREQPHHRTPLPLWIKLPAIALVITGIVLIKHHLAGFMTLFPMVGVVAAYEARKSLWTLVRRIPWVMLFMMPMMAIIRLAQVPLGTPASLALGWGALLLQLWLMRAYYHTHIPAACDPAAPSAPPDLSMFVQQRSAQP